MVGGRRATAPPPPHMVWSGFPTPGRSALPGRSLRAPALSANVDRPAASGSGSGRAPPTAEPCGASVRQPRSGAATGAELLAGDGLGMAEAAARYGVDKQYGGHGASAFLHSTILPNALTARVSDDYIPDIKRPPDACNGTDPQSVANRGNVLLALHGVEQPHSRVLVAAGAGTVVGEFLLDAEAVVGLHVAPVVG